MMSCQVTDGEGGRVWNVRERKGEGGLHLRVQLESSVSAAAATTLPQRNMDLLFSLCSAAHFPPKSHLKLFQFRTRDARRRSVPSVIPNLPKNNFNISDGFVFSRKFALLLPASFDCIFLCFNFRFCFALCSLAVKRCSLFVRVVVPKRCCFSVRVVV